MSATMITPVECRQHAIECQRMVKRAANLRMQSILIDMARTWQRLALEVEQQFGDQSASWVPKCDGSSRRV
jgi:alkyl hydroperoxide reductase subunit AhpF